MTTASPDPELMALLARHRALGSAPAAEHAWLAAHGARRALAQGEVLLAGNRFASKMHVMFSGRVVIRVDRGAGSHKIFEWHGGDVSGALPFSRGAKAPNDVVAEEPTDVLEISAADLPEMIRECPAVTSTLVHAMVDRARQFKASDLHDEKLLSLGKLAAGLAHELNNPASAAVRSAKLLAESLAVAENASVALASMRLTDAQLAAVDGVRMRCAAPTGASSRSTVARADREDAIAEWLADHGANEQCAAPLAETGLSLQALDALAAAVSGAALDASLCWIAAGCAVRALSAEIETATTRIYDLVGSVKGFTFMDRAPMPEPIDIRRGIEDTLTMLGGKMRAKGAEVTTHFAADLPRAHAVGAELNQVWMNLIDNALDAIPPGGHVEVRGAAERGRVVVRVIDDGAGIPPDIMGNVFDPFFTTKDVGKGTGLGLDIVRRILQRHDGEVDVDSRPGHTEFRVDLPAEA
jgi:signal transduction histidine kinase